MLSILSTLTTAAVLFITASASPTQIYSNSAPTSMGCWTDNYPSNNGVRTLNDASTSGGMSTESCASFCSAYNYFGTEYGNEVRRQYMLVENLKLKLSL